MSSFSNTEIKKWTTDMLVDWVNSSRLTDNWKQIVINPIKENDVTGSDIYSIKTGEDLANSFGIKNKIACNKVIKQLNELKKKKREDAIKDAATNNPTDDLDEKDANNEKFELQLNVQGKLRPLDQWVTMETTIKEVKKWYKEQSGCKSKIEDIEMYYLRVAMKNDQTLGQHKLNKHQHLISIKFDAVGGAEARIRRIRFKRYNLIRSNEPDCLIGYDDSDGIDRAEIGCPKKHAMAADTMYDYIVQVLEKNMQVTKIACPHCKCILDWNKCTQIADMNAKEYGQWTRVIEKRLDGDKTRPCPNCSADCARKKGVVIFRMNCTACGGPDWCWVCAKKWKAGGLTYCGNDGCQLITETNAIMDAAKMITPKYLNSVKVPDVRACPRCLTLIKHKQDCKHMKCPGCNKEFCFVCLALQNSDDTWPCNSYDDECPPKGKQKFT